MKYIIILILVLPLVSATHDLTLTMNDYQNNYQEGIEVERNYIINIPNELKQKTDLVIFFHGTTNNYQDIISQTDLISLSNEEGFILTFPQSMGISRQVEEIFEGDNIVRRNPDDDKFIDLMIEEVNEKYNINNIYLMGLSNGCGMAQHLAMTRDDIKGIAIGGCGIPMWNVKNYLNSLTLNNRKPFSVFRFHDVDDPISQYMFLGDEIPEGRTPTGEIAIDIFSQINGCGELEISEVNLFRDINVDLWDYKNCKVNFYKIYSNNHIWHTELNQEIWRFFNE